MAHFDWKRLLTAGVLLSVTAVVMLSLMQSNPRIPSQAGEEPSQSTIDALNEKYGLDKPVSEQWAKDAANLLKGDIGVSIKLK